MQRFSHCRHVRYSFRRCSGARILPNRTVPTIAEGFLATPLPRRRSAIYEGWFVPGCQGYPPGTGNAQFRPNIARNSLRFRCSSANRIQ